MKSSALHTTSALQPPFSTPRKRKWLGAGRVAPQPLRREKGSRPAGHEFVAATESANHASDNNGLFCQEAFCCSTYAIGANAERGLAKGGFSDSQQKPSQPTSIVGKSRLLAPGPRQEPGTHWRCTSAPKSTRTIMFAPCFFRGCQAGGTADRLREPRSVVYPDMYPWKLHYPRHDCERASSFTSNHRRRRPCALAKQIEYAPTVSAFTSVAARSVTRHVSGSQPGEEASSGKLGKKSGQATKATRRQNRESPKLALVPVRRPPFEDVLEQITKGIVVENWEAMVEEPKEGKRGATSLGVSLAETKLLELDGGWSVRFLRDLSRKE
jgi:hypothetical protein